jgi:NitT/TauT family transport system ATP-binding protein
MFRMSTIELSNVSKWHKTSTGIVTALADISATFASGRCVAVFGGNGSGKTTLLRVIAGLTAPDQGTVTIAGKPPSKVRIGYVDQEYRTSLFGWMSVLENILFPLTMRGGPNQDDLSFLNRLEVHMGTQYYRRAYPYMLSGGQQQLVSVVRALVSRPDVLLMDEPFASLDHRKARALALMLGKVLQEFPVTTLFVTHDIDMAMSLAHDIYVLQPTEGGHELVAVRNDHTAMDWSAYRASALYAQRRSKILDHAY